MNIFYLHKDPQICAEMHCDKHVVKMIIEYAQLMSTTHRILDGEQYLDLTANGRKIKRWRMHDSQMEQGLMKASHINHPSNVWVRAGKENYMWLYQMWLCLMKEYTHRYEKHHACESRIKYLMSPPKNISVATFTEPTPAMPDDVKVAGDSIKSYHNYYINNKTHLASWKKRNKPEWYSAIV